MSSGGVRPCASLHGQADRPRPALSCAPATDHRRRLPAPASDSEPLGGFSSRRGCRPGRGGGLAGGAARVAGRPAVIHGPV